MSNSFFQYWKFSQATFQISLQQPVEHSASSQLKRVKAGDRVWIVTVDPDGELFLVGHVDVDEVMTQAKALKRFGKNIYEAPFHIAAKTGTEELPCLISLMEIASKVQFSSKSGNDRLCLEDGLINPQQLQTMRLLTEESARLVEQLWFTPKLPDAKELEKRVSHGAGFGSPERNKAVEKAAVAVVTKDYLQRGWEVQSVESLKCGYDLVCTYGSQTEHVEIKGISGTEPAFIITRGEVQQARQNPNFVLCVVTSALLPEPRLRRYTGQEFITKFQLQEIAFRASLTSYGLPE